MSVSDQTLQNSASQSESVTCPSRRSFQTACGSKVRGYDRRVFHQYYEELCARRGLLPVACCKGQCRNGVLDLNADRVGLGHWGPLLSALCADRSLEHITIRSKHHNKKVIQSADTKLKTMAVSQRPVLYTQYVLSLLMDALAGCVQRNCVLVSLELESLPLDKETLGPLVQAMKGCRTLQQLSLQGCPLGDTGCELVCATLRNLPSVVTLNLSRCGLSSSGAAHVASLLEYQKIQRLNECWRHSLRYREADLDAIQGLRRVTLNGNMLRDEGLARLVDAATDDLWLRALDLQHCGLSDVGVRQVLELLQYNTSLAIVDVRLNTAVSAEMLARVMKQLHTNHAHHDPQYDWWPVKALRPIRKSFSQSLQLKLEKKSVCDFDDQRNSSDLRLKKCTASSGKNLLPSQGITLRDYKQLEEQRDAALLQLRMLEAQLQQACKERDEALSMVNELLAGQPQVPDGLVLVPPDMLLAMEDILKMAQSNGFKM
ncbi:centrosomal protein of 78 kDa isoform X2 [Bacillus rossius redtenbacheri]|uniref:centrosomal protein of 78 kDa isoform X2 n=1 Tax=Bacillus rossius redtenbacheri TaxID=93214 RepID=UPI002FDDE338